MALPDRVLKNFTVKLKLSEQSDPRQTMPIRNPRLGFIKPDTMEGKYKVVIDPASWNEYDRIECRGILEALEAYKKSNIHLLLEIVEDDIGATSPSRLPIYKLPEGSSEIEIVDKKLVPISFRLEAIE